MNVPYRANPPGEPWCGPAALQMVLAFYGLEIDLDDLITACRSRRSGTLSSDMVTAVRGFGLHTHYVEGLTVSEVAHWLDEETPVILLVDAGLLYNVIGPSGHFVVGIDKDDRTILYHDSDVGQNLIAPIDVFETAWEAKGRKAVRIWKR